MTLGKKEAFCSDFLLMHLFLLWRAKLFILIYPPPCAYTLPEPIPSLNFQEGQVQKLLSRNMWKELIGSGIWLFPPDYFCVAVTWLSPPLSSHFLLP